MKKLSFLLFAVLVAGLTFAQGNSANPVSWTFTSKKISDNVYELQMTATIESGWHLYSQSQPEDAIAQPTSFRFTKNPLLDLDGKVKEVGKMEKFKDAQLGVSANQYSDRVVFTQRVKLKGKAKTNVVGNVEFQTCDDSKCLPPKTINFNIALK
ncbi:MAG TPA: protein-disulfide reductase DsbD domain-containing protein [Flavisolibacter sp.]|nr:protein-disulfide reductase DsbD domain-containing protein [Flavisolibacter sp.]